MGPAIYHPRLWQLNRHGVALGFAIGLFFGFLIPILQIPSAAVVAVWLRANILVAVISTLVSNPFTYAPIYFFAYQLGSLITSFASRGAIENSIDNAMLYESSSQLYLLIDYFFTLGKPLLVGLSVLAVTGGAVGFVGVLVLWRIIILLEWQRRRFRG